MNIKLLSSDNYTFFINKLFIKEQLLDKESIIDYVKKIILNKRKALNLRGFYKVVVYYNKNIGIFMETFKLEDSCYFNNLDLKVIVNTDSEIYFEVEDYFLIKDCKEIRYLNGKYYVEVDNLTKIIKIIEFGRFIYGQEVNNVLAKSIVI